MERSTKNKAYFLYCTELDGVLVDIEGGIKDKTGNVRKGKVAKISFHQAQGCNFIWIAFSEKGKCVGILK